MAEPLEFSVGDRVTKSTGDYSFSGFVQAAFHKRLGAARYVVENQDGILHIFSGKQLVRLTPHPATGATP